MRTPPLHPLQTVAVAVAAAPAQSQEFQASPRRPVAVAAVYEVYEHPRRLLHQHEMRAHLHRTHHQHHQHHHQQLLTPPLHPPQTPVAAAATPAQSQESQASLRRPVAVAAAYEVYEHPRTAPKQRPSRLLPQHAPAPLPQEVNTCPLNKKKWLQICVCVCVLYRLLPLSKTLVSSDSTACRGGAGALLSALSGS
jgi:hypothetical protein